MKECDKNEMTEVLVQLDADVKPSEKRGSAGSLGSEMRSHERRIEALSENL